MFRIQHAFLLSALSLAFLLPSSNLVADEDFTQQAKAIPTGEERTTQPRFWLMEVEYKQLRLVWIPVKNEKDGTVEKKPVWYLCYRALRRPIAKIGDTGLTPNNPANPEPGPAFFIPEFTLITKDGDEPAAYSDVLIPEALAKIREIEGRDYKNSVQVVAPLPEPSKEQIGASKETFYGVAMWRDVDPGTDRFTIVMNGFSGGYKVSNGPEGKPIISRKVLMQSYWRPGDQFDQESTEFRFDGDPKWIYRPDTRITSEKTAAPSTKSDSDSEDDKEEKVTADKSADKADDSKE